MNHETFNAANAGRLPVWGWILIASAIVAVAAYLRIVMVEETEVLAPIRADAREYYNYAYNLKSKGIYSLQDINDSSTPVPDAERNPGYSLFILPFVEYPPTYEMIERIAWAQVALSVLTLVLAMVWFRSFLPYQWALLAGMFVALSPHLIAANVYVLTETLFTFCLTAFLAAVGWLGATSHWSKALLAGALLGVALLVRPTLLYFPIFLLPALFFMVPWRRAAALGCVLLLGFCLVYGPWVIRNFSLPGDIQSTKALDTVHKGMYPDLMYRGDPRTYGFPNRVDPEWNKRADSLAKVLEEIRNRFAAEPVRYLRWYLIGKPVMLLSWDIIVGMGDVFVYPVTKSPYLHLGLFDITHRLMRGFHWPITILALVGCVLSWMPSSRRYLPDNAVISTRIGALVIAYFLLVHMAGTPLPRYGIPLRPLVYGLGVLGGVMGYRMLTSVHATAGRDTR